MNNLWEPREIGGHRYVGKLREGLSAWLFETRVLTNEEYERCKTENCAPDVGWFLSLFDHDFDPCVLRPDRTWDEEKVFQWAERTIQAWSGHESNS